jgi:hypothetical protein
VLKKCNKRHTLIGNDIVTWIITYPRTLTSNREFDHLNPAMYLDAAQVQPHYTVSKPWQYENEIGVWADMTTLAKDS